MALLGSILINRTLKQFLDCQDLTSSEGVELTGKIRDAARGSMDKVLEVIPSTSKPHSEILINICAEVAKGGHEDLLLDSLDNDNTLIRATAAQVLTKSSQINPDKLFKRLHESDVSKTEIIQILELQKKSLKPEQLITNAIRLDKEHAEQLLKLIAGSEIPLDLSSLRIEPGKIADPNLKLVLLRFLGDVDHNEVAGLIGRFLADKNKTIAMEALKALNRLKTDFDVSFLLPYLGTMSNMERELGLQILIKQASPELVPELAAWTTGKSDKLRETLIKLVVKHVNQENLGEFLQRLDLEEWWGKEQALKCLQKLGTNQLYSAAQGLVDHKHEFVRNTAQQFSAQQVDPANISKIGETATHEQWQIRENAIQALGNSGKREALIPLKRSLDKWPESAVAILNAIGQLGFSKGLEIAFYCLRMQEALVQRAALETIAALATKQYADKIRAYILKRVPSLQAIVKDTAEEVVNQLTSDYGLSELNIDDENFFDTRLIKAEQTQGETTTSSTSTLGGIPVNIEDLKDGDTWMDRYRIKKEIGRGAMGRVMLAEDEMVGEMLILKFMLPELTADSDSMERFSREVKYSRKVSHNNVIRIHDLLSKDGLSAISMEYFESRGIDEFLKEVESFDVKTGLGILYQVSEGMIAAHNQKVIHRDLKPSNILMDETGLVKVVDFGIASVSANADSTLTQVGSIIGTPAYLSPERSRGKEADYRCDIYALGIIAYCMLTGQLPYIGETMAILFQHIEGKAPPIHEVNNSIDLEVSKLVQKIMAAKVENRFQTMQEVSDAIKGQLQKL
ncbi:MAG: protein kinase [Gammaproteobacteria bacterium]|nr:protein kinase [Gammaproteobacteria bacterium]